MTDVEAVVFCFFGFFLPLALLLFELTFARQVLYHLNHFASPFFHVGYF
jgi:hypothetical protein